MENVMTFNTTKKKRIDFASESGFTLMELIIVVAVLAILIGILLPQFSGITDKALAVAVGSEVKNAYTALVNYKTNIEATNKKFEVEKAKSAVNLALGGTESAAPTGYTVNVQANGEASIGIVKGDLTFTGNFNASMGGRPTLDCKVDNGSRCTDLFSEGAVDTVNGSVPSPNPQP